MAPDASAVASRRFPVSREIRLLRRRFCGARPSGSRRAGMSLSCIRIRTCSPSPSSMAVRIPESVPPRRATLAANMETALNALWDGGAGPADHIVVVGAGVVGLLIAYLAARMPGTRVTVTDTVPARGAIAVSFGAQFVAPEAVEGAGGRSGVSHQRVGTRSRDGAVGCRIGSNDRRTVLVRKPFGGSTAWRRISQSAAQARFIASGTGLTIATPAVESPPPAGSGIGIA